MNFNNSAPTKGKALVNVAYYDPFDLYAKLKEDLESKLPLTNLHLKLENAPLKSIPILPINIIEEIPNSISAALNVNNQINPPSDSFDLNSSHSQSILFNDLINAVNDPYLKIMFFQCANGIDEYRTKVRPFIKEWFKQSIDTSKLPTDWLLVYYIPEGVKDDVEARFKTTLLDKIKFDFNSYNSPNTSAHNLSVRVLKIKAEYSNKIEYDSNWNNFLTKIKDSILNTFNNRISFYKSVILDLVNTYPEKPNTDESSILPSSIVESFFKNYHSNINIGLYLLLNENLGILFNHLTFYEDSLLYYDNLEKIFQFFFEKFLNSNEDKNPTFIEKVGFNDISISKNCFYFNFFENDQNQFLIDLSNNFLDIFSSIPSNNALSKKLQINTYFDLFKKIRLSILDNASSYFQLKVYIFWNQSILINSLILSYLESSAYSPAIISIHLYQLLKRLETFIVDMCGALIDNKISKKNIIKIAEWSYSIVDSYMLLIQEFYFTPGKLTRTMFDPNSINHFLQNREINDALGNLFITKRFFLIVLGKRYNYKLNYYFTDKLTHINTVNYLFKGENDSVYEFDYSPLKKALTNQKTFQEYFVELTESAINHFNIADKPRNVDILSIDIAMINFQNKNYRDSLLVLQNCPTFYNEQGWKYIGFYLLKVYICCLENTIEEDEITLSKTNKESGNYNSLYITVQESKTTLLTSYLDLLSTILSSSNKFNSISLSDLKIQKNSDSFEDIDFKQENLTEKNNESSNFFDNDLENINKFLINSKEINDVLIKILNLKDKISVEYDLSNLFVFKISKFISSKKLNTYDIELLLKNLLLHLDEKEEAFKFDEIKLTLKSIDDDSEVISFVFNPSSPDESIVFKKGTNVITLGCKDLITGKFILNSLVLKMGKLKFTKDFLDEDHREYLIDGSNQSSYQVNQFVLYPFFRNLTLDLNNPLSLNLSQKMISIKLNNGSFDIFNGYLEFWSGTEGFEIIEDNLSAFTYSRQLEASESSQIAYYKNYNSSRFLKKKKPTKLSITCDHTDENNAKFKFNEISPNSTVEIIVPYKLNEQVPLMAPTINKNLIKLKTKITYFVKENDNKVRYSLVDYEDINTALCVSVSVQDSFKSSKLFSKFSIGTSDINVPIRVMGSRLRSNNNYKVSSAIKPKPLIAFGNQPVCHFFKIEPRSDKYIVKKKDSINLNVQYRSLSDESFEILWYIFISYYLFRNGFEEEKDIHFRTKESFIDHILILKKFLRRVIFVDFNRYGLMNEINILPINYKIVNEFLINIDYKCQKRIQESLYSFLEEINNGKALNYLKLEVKGFSLNNSNHNNISDEIEIKNKKLDELFLSVSKNLNIAVPIPLIQVIHIVEFEFEENPQYIVGQAISTKLKIKTLINWRGEETTDFNENKSLPAGEVVGGNKKNKKRVLFIDPNEDLKIEEFSIDIQTNQDAWLISGKRSFLFEIDKKNKEQIEFLSPDVDIVLIPLKIGQLLLPEIEIKAINNHLNDSFTMEIDYKNSSQTLLIVPDLDRVTFAF
ncbi:transport protein particle complex II subunit TRS130 ASCRUDRAFT_14955 [Ascoidea rubescens DSM 1968]|uniref:Trafficking protein particle complex II-specific subunit 130 n=1 Tax=Ascoidea rubescens DSM 1968 TaxID=1344418 RepID=A0A1D2VCK6_9ASCO|nr:hypothetical protein ASCRUDRAFT_14955 [Ascoidea rubescens DSM 1968]ODV59187.1 hypothetical protein ASCRUDRAFT_14955 [Ascoidea rubescens DSM 1968]